MNFQYFDDASCTPNSPVTEREFVCTELTPTRAVFTDVTETDPLKQYSITLVTRPANTDTRVRQKCKVTIIAPAVINSGETDEYIDLAIYRLEIEVPSAWSYANRLSIARNMIQKFQHLSLQTDVAHAMNYGYMPQ